MAPYDRALISMTDPISNLLSDRRKLTYYQSIKVRPQGNPPVFSSRQKWNYAANANFCIGVMPPSARSGRPTPELSRAAKRLRLE